MVNPANLVFLYANTRLPALTAVGGRKTIKRRIQPFSMHLRDRLLFRKNNHDMRTQPPFLEMLDENMRPSVFLQEK